MEVNGLENIKEALTVEDHAVSLKNNIANMEERSKQNKTKQNKIKYK